MLYHLFHYNLIVITFQYEDNTKFIHPSKKVPDLYYLIHFWIIFNHLDIFNKMGYRPHQCQIGLYTLPLSKVVKHVYRNQFIQNII